MLGRVDIAVAAWMAEHRKLVEALVGYAILVPLGVCFVSLWLTPALWLCGAPFWASLGYTAGLGWVLGFLFATFYYIKEVL